MPKNFVGLVFQIIGYITFERIVIACLFMSLVSMIFIFVRQQSTINSMSEELSSLRTLIAQ